MERKSLIIAKDDVRNLTFNEVFKMYKGLIDKKAGMWAQSYEYEDMVQVASLALWKAYKNYDGSKPVGFGLLARTYIERALLKHNQLNKPKTENVTSQISSIVSLEEKIFTDSNGKELTLQGLIYGGDSFPEQIVERIILNRVIEKLNEKQKRYLSLIMQGYGSKELAEAENIKLSAMSMRRTLLFRKMRALYLENTNLNHKKVAI